MFNKLWLSFILVVIVGVNFVQTIKADVHDRQFDVKRWWFENNDYDYNPHDLKFVKINKQKYQFLAPGKDAAPDYSRFLKTPNNDLTDDSLESQQNFNKKIKSEADYDIFNFIHDDTEISKTKSKTPRSSVKSLLNSFHRYFTTVRSHKMNGDFYDKVKQSLKINFIKLGLTTALQSFWPPEMEEPENEEIAHNIVGVWPGPHRGTSRDQIIIIGGHYDSVPKAPGVDDNGSGCAAVLEMALLITKHNCKFDKTIMFVLFDMEEDGLKGSKHFVKDYLIPIEVEQNGAQIVGAIIMDMILAYNTTNGSQLVGKFESSTPEWAVKVKQNGFRGNFVSVWARTGTDAPLYETLTSNWVGGDRFKLFIMDSPLPSLGQDLDLDEYKPYSTFLRSDHASFWYPTRRNISFNAILLHDMGPWRHNMDDRYHTDRDDKSSLTQPNLEFVKNTVDSVMKTVLDIANGMCY